MKRLAFALLMFVMFMGVVLWVGIDLNPTLHRWQETNLVDSRDVLRLLTIDVLYIIFWTCVMSAFILRKPTPAAFVPPGVDTDSMYYKLGLAYASERTKGGRFFVEDVDSAWSVAIGFVGGMYRKLDIDAQKQGKSEFYLAFQYRRQLEQTEFVGAVRHREQ